MLVMKEYAHGVAKGSVEFSPPLLEVRGGAGVLWVMEEEEETGSYPRGERGGRQDG
jgi:hypothetical protein